MRDLSRLLSPRSIAVVGGGAWGMQVVRQSIAMGFEGYIYRVHPDPTPVEGVAAVPTLGDLPVAPDAVFLGINRHATLAAVKELSGLGAGGAVCFASGFSEAAAEDTGSVDLQTALVAAAGDMPILGPNCYGFVNALDGALLWPDQHGCTPVSDGVAILTQSSNIAINLTMQRRDLPVAFVVTCGNMAQTAQAEIAMALLDDPRVTAIGLHVEGFGDPLVWHALALKAAERNVPLIALKVGASDQARSATLSHTASLAGSDAGAAALLQYLGIARVSDLSTFLEALMLLHCDGPLPSTRIASISCSGGEASLVADMAQAAGLDLPALTGGQRRDLEAALGPMVAVANPLDYHTYIWGDVAKMTAGWLPMAQGDADLVMIVVDYPHTDASAWVSATDAAIAVRAQSDCAVAVVASLPELLPPDVARRLRGAGVTPLHGLYEALGAVRAVAQVSAPAVAPPLMPAANGLTDVVSEADAKAGLGAFGVPVPQGCVASRAALAQSAEALDGPLVLKGMGFAHKSEAGAVVLKLTHDTLAPAAEKMGGDIFLIEEMVQGSVAELLVGVLRDPAHGYLLTLGAGGVMTELLHDTQCLLLPVTQEQVARALAGLRCYPLLTGFRGASPARIDAIISAVMALQDYVIAHQDRLYEVEINPLICTADEAVAADALIVQLAEAKQKGVAHGTG